VLEDLEYARLNGGDIPEPDATLELTSRGIAVRHRRRISSNAADLKRFCASSELKRIWTVTISFPDIKEKALIGNTWPCHKAGKQPPQEIGKIVEAKVALGQR